MPRAGSPSVDAIRERQRTAGALIDVEFADPGDHQRLQPARRIVRTGAGTPGIVRIEETRTDQVRDARAAHDEIGELALFLDANFDRGRRIHSVAGEELIPPCRL